MDGSLDAAALCELAAMDEAGREQMHAPLAARVPN